MKMIIRIIGTLLAIVKLSMASDVASEIPYISQNILEEVKKISLDNLLDFKKIAVAIEDKIDKARFHYNIAYEINRRKKLFDKKFISREKEYLKAITNYENELELTPFQYTDKRPRFDYVFQTAAITDETVANDIHRIQAELSRTQFIQLHQYYKRRLDNYKYYLITLQELYNCKVKKNTDKTEADYSNFTEMYQGIKLFHYSMDDARKVHVQRDVLGKILYIEWRVEGETDTARHRNFEYFDGGLLSKITDKINDEIIFETIFGENKLGSIFFEYIFSPGFIPRNYNYYTEVFYLNNRASAYKITSMNGHVIGTIHKEFDTKDHLIRETWYNGETSKILREFTSTFDSTIGGYKLIERDRYGKIVNQEVVLSSIN